jgi:hypothetical protein
MVTRSLTVIEDGESRARSLYVFGNRVIITDRDRRIEFRVRELIDDDPVWLMLSKLAPHIMAASDRAEAIERLADRCRTGWIPVAGEIDPLVPQRTMLRCTFAVDAMRYPDFEDFYSPATKLLGRDDAGFGMTSGEILWIAADLSFAICDDGMWWLT